MERALSKPIEQNLDLKREQRRFRVYFMYLDGQSQTAIAEVLEIGRSTVVEDLNEMRRRVAERPILDMEAIRQETYQRMVTLRSEIIAAARETNSVTGKPKLYEAASKIDLKILERYTQTKGQIAETKKSSDIGIAVIDYLKERFGPEEITKFTAWYENRIKVESRIKEALKK